MPTSVRAHSNPTASSGEAWLDCSGGSGGRHSTDRLGNQVERPFAPQRLDLVLGPGKVAHSRPRVQQCLLAAPHRRAWSPDADPSRTRELGARAVRLAASRDDRTRHRYGRVGRARCGRDRRAEGRCDRSLSRSGCTQPLGERRRGDGGDSNHLLPLPFDAVPPSSTTVRPGREVVGCDRCGRSDSPRWPDPKWCSWRRCSRGWRIPPSPTSTRIENFAGSPTLWSSWRRRPW